MGIKQLAKLIKDKCPNCVKTHPLAYYTSKVIAVDASLAIYQFLIAVRSEGSALGVGENTTSHLVGMFYRTIRLVEAGIIPLYVFDGTAPLIKAGELGKRTKRRDDAENKLQQAIQAEDLIKIERYTKMRTKIEKIHVEECQKLLKLMGVPFVIAESEAEAYCSILCQNKCVDYVATEDMDTLCFGGPILLRNLNGSLSKKLDIEEYDLATILKSLELSMDPFIDLCILMGCDFSSTIKGIGPKKALSLIYKYGSIDRILEKEEDLKKSITEEFNYEGARECFKSTNIKIEKIKFSIDYDGINIDGLIEFLVGEKRFDEKRVRNGIERMLKTQKLKKQLKLDSFFTKSKIT